MTHSIRQFILKRSISKAISIRNEKKIFNFETARKVCVIFTITEVSHINLIREFIQILSNKKMKVNALGWINADQIPVNAHESLSFSILTKKDLNFWGIPTSERYQQIENQEFDVLIDLTWEPNLITSYLSSHIHAGMKIAREDDKTIPIFDLMIRINSTEKQQILHQQIIHYLTLINPAQTNKNNLKKSI